MKFRSKTIFRLILILCIFVAVFFRMLGLNWDQNHHLHPDERFLTMVTGAVKWPSSISEYIDPFRSPLNPYNVGYSFFVYGTLPMLLTKFFSQVIVIDNYDYNNITLVGRLLSVIFDLGVLVLVFLIAKRILNKTVALLATFYYSVSVLPIQLSHFYAVDTYLQFFIILSFYFLLRYLQDKKGEYQNIILVGVVVGLALGSKLTALFLIPFALLGLLYKLFSRKRQKKLVFLHLGLFILVAYFSFRLVDPRVFANVNMFDFRLNSQFLSNLRQLQVMSSPESTFPPGIQWKSTKVLIFPLRNMILWGFGIPLAILVVSGLLLAIWQKLALIKKILSKFSLNLLKKIRPKDFFIFLMLLWIVGLFVYQGLQFTKTMRYFYPVYPFMVIFAANFSYHIYLDIIKFVKYKIHFLLIFFVFHLTVLIYPISFLSIYLKPHSRVQASEWIYKNIPKGSVISCEHWDDCLPLGLLGKNSQSYLYKTELLELYHEDNYEKWNKIRKQLDRLDYFIMSSNRLWGSIPKVPEIYPRTSRFYQDLFAEKLDFSKLVEINSYPCFPPVGKPWFCFSDKYADENFTVFDHPQILIYQKEK